MPPATGLGLTLFRLPDIKGKDVLIALENITRVVQIDEKGSCVIHLTDGGSFLAGLSFSEFVNVFRSYTLQDPIPFMRLYEESETLVEKKEGSSYFDWAVMEIEVLRETLRRKEDEIVAEKRSNLYSEMEGHGT